MNADEFYTTNAMLTLTFGILYALYITFIRHVNTRYTWFLVFVGCMVTNAGISLAYYTWLDLPLMTWPPPTPVLILWIWYTLTGGPMIAFQVGKNKIQDQIIEAERDDEEAL